MREGFPRVRTGVRVRVALRRRPSAVVVRGASTARGIIPVHAPSGPLARPAPRTRRKPHDRGGTPMTSPPGGSRLGRAMGSGRAPVPGGAVSWRRRYGSGAETVLVAAGRGACRWRTGSCWWPSTTAPTSRCGSSPRSSRSPRPPSAESSSACGRSWRSSRRRGPSRTSHGCGSWTEPSSRSVTVRRPRPPATTGSRPTGAPEDDDGLTAEDRLTSIRAESTCPG